MNPWSAQEQKVRYYKSNMASTNAVKDYMDYATIHGIYRTKNTPYIVLKIFWVLALCASLAMIIWQVHDLFKKYQNHPISTSMEIKTAESLKFPLVTICNTNPAQYSKIEQHSTSLEDVILEASTKYSIDMEIYNSSDIYSYNYSAYDSENKNNPISSDILWQTTEKFRMRMSVLDFHALQGVSQEMKEFMLLCNFAGEPCTTEAITTARSYDYGLCYKFQPTEQEPLKPHGNASAAGPRYSLEVLLNVDQSDSVPFVASSSGVIIGIEAESQFFHPENGIFIPTGFEANIALTHVKEDRVAGMSTNSRCQETDSERKTLLDCHQRCKQKDIVDNCECYQYFFEFDSINQSVPLSETFESETGYRPCYTDQDYACIHDLLAGYIKRMPQVCSGCLPPCSEVVYKRDVSIVSWPGENFLPILRRIMQSKVPNIDLDELDRNFVRGNVALVRIYLSSLSYQTIKEEYAYSEVDFISDIGGQLGLWAGFSVLSLFEVIELFLLLCASSRHKKTVPEGKEEPFPPEIHK